MNKIVPILIQLVNILTLISASTTLAAEREYIVPMEKSEWQSSTKEQHECTLSQIIPFYAEGKFIHKSGHKVKFDLFSDEPGQLNPALQFSELSNKKGSHQTRVLR
ncbi:MAG: hypothetical protein LC437_05100 [Thiohalomonas sp.]|nr:hypothetical protein [Thiohalomonas sp.]